MRHRLAQHTGIADAVGKEQDQPGIDEPRSGQG